MRNAGFSDIGSWGTNIDTTSIRDAFEAFVGTERFNQFLTVFNSDTRSPRVLRFWQSKLWAEFVNSYSGDAPAVDDIRNLTSVFNICPLHRVELEFGVTKVVPGLTPFEPSLAYARKLLFPLANLFTYTDHTSGSTSTIPTKFCPFCRVAYSDWIAQDTLSDAEVSEVIEIEGRIIAVFEVPFQASYKVVSGMRVLVQPPNHSCFETRITKLERLRDCFSDGRTGRKIMFAVLADVTNADCIPVGTVLSFMNIH